MYLFDDKFKSNSQYKNKLLTFGQITNLKFDKIIISPGIDISDCKLTKYLKKNLSNIYTDLDIFYS